LLFLKQKKEIYYEYVTKMEKQNDTKPCLSHNKSDITMSKTTSFRRVYKPDNRNTKYFNIEDVFICTQNKDNVETHIFYHKKSIKEKKK